MYIEQTLSLGGRDGSFEDGKQESPARRAPVSMATSVGPAYGAEGQCFSLVTKIKPVKLFRTERALWFNDWLKKKKKAFITRHSFTPILKSVLIADPSYVSWVRCNYFRKLSQLWELQLKPKYYTNFEKFLFMFFFISLFLLIYRSVFLYPRRFDTINSFRQWK